MSTQFKVSFIKSDGSVLWLIDHVNGVLGRPNKDQGTVWNNPLELTNIVLHIKDLYPGAVVSIFPHKPERTVQEKHKQLINSLVIIRNKAHFGSATLLETTIELTKAIEEYR